MPHLEELGSQVFALDEVTVDEIELGSNGPSDHPYGSRGRTPQRVVQVDCRSCCHLLRERGTSQSQCGNIANTK